MLAQPGPAGLPRRRARALVAPVFACLVVLAMAPSHARAQAEAAPSWLLCRAAIVQAEREAGLSPGLMLAIALVESGRGDPRSGRIEPWPWTLNAGGEGRYLSTRSEAVAAVTALREAGTRSVDVGCMQINLFYHPHAFNGLEQAFDPLANARYAARFLRELYGRTGDWSLAVAQYHSGDAERGSAYQRRVALARLAGAWGTGGVVPLPAAAGVVGLCAPGLRPALMIRPAAARRAGPAARTRIVCQGSRGGGRP